MKTKLMKMIEGGKLHDEQYVFSPKELQAIMDKAFEEQREKCFSVYENGYLKNESHLMQQDNLLMAPQPETGIEL